MHITAAASATPRDDNFPLLELPDLSIEALSIDRQQSYLGHKERDIFSRSTLTVMRATRLSMLCPPLLSMGRATRESTPDFASRIMLPPRPPSPPSGPPRATYFSLRKLLMPLPPLPATSSTLIRSTNHVMASRAQYWGEISLRLGQC